MHVKVKQILRIENFLFGRTLHMIFITFLDPLENSLYSICGFNFTCQPFNYTEFYQTLPQKWTNKTGHYIYQDHMTKNLFQIYLIENKVECNKDCRASELCVVFGS